MFGQQSANPIASAAKWIFFGFFGVVLMGFLLGANIKDATWLNSEIAAAEANRINIENAHQQATYALQERLANAQTEAEIQKIRREQELLDAKYEHDKQILAQDVVNKQHLADTVVTVVIYVGGATGIAAVVSALILAISKAIATLRATPIPQSVVSHSNIPTMQILKPQLVREPYDPWTSPMYRQKQIKAARREERKQRKQVIVVHRRAFKDTSRMSQDEYKKRPLAGD